MTLALELESPPRQAKTRIRGPRSTRRSATVLAALTAALAVTLMLPCLRAGWEGDDIIHRLVMTGPTLASELAIPNQNTPTGLFTFLDGKPLTNHRLRDIGIVPWWTHPDVKSSFLRPLAWATHWLDDALWPNSAVLMHLQSLFWYGILVLFAVLAYRGLLGSGPGLLVAALLFAVDDSHATAAGWIANRNAVLAAMFGIATLWAHIRWRRDQSGLAAALAPILFLAALLSSEGAVTAGAFLLGYELFLGRRSWASRFIALAPYVLVGAAWRISWSWMGFGSEAMGLYTDPVRDPGGFLAALLHRAPAVLLSAFGGVPAETGAFLSPPAQTALWIAGIALTAVLILVMIPLLRRDAAARFFAFSTLAAIVPCCVTIPSDRNLLFVSFAALGLIGRFVTSALGSTRATIPRFRVSWPATAVAALLVLVHGLIAPAAKPFRAAMPLGPQRITGQLEVGAALPNDVGHKDVIIVNPPSAFHIGYLPVRRALAGDPIPAHVRVLGSSMDGLTLKRLDERTLEVIPEGGYLRSPFDRVFRGPQVAFKGGEHIELPGVMIEVGELNGEGLPASATFRFSRPLEDASLVWLQWQDGRFVPFTPPEVGKSATLAAPVPTW